GRRDVAWVAKLGAQADRKAAKRAERRPVPRQPPPDHGDYLRISGIDLPSYVARESPLRFLPPEARLAAGTLDKTWRLLQVSFDMEDPRLFPVLVGAADPITTRAAMRFLANAKILSESSLLIEGARFAVS